MTQLEVLMTVAVMCHIVMTLSYDMTQSLAPMTVAMMCHSLVM